MALIFRSATAGAGAAGMLAGDVPLLERGMPLTSIHTPASAATTSAALVNTRRLISGQLRRGRGGTRIAEARDGIDEPLDKRVLELVRLELLFLLSVRDESHFDEHRRHVGADEDAEGSLLDRARAHRHAFAQRRFDGLGESRRRLDVAGLRRLPEDQLDVAHAAADDRKRLAPPRAARCAASPYSSRLR